MIQREIIYRILRGAGGNDCARLLPPSAPPQATDLFRTATSLLGNRTEAEDAVQETYLQAWKSFHRFTPNTNCRAWLYRVPFHVIAHQQQKWLNRFIATERTDIEQTATYSVSVPEELTDEEILGAIRNIPQQYAEVVMLADVHEFSYKEIQETLEIPIGTVMSRLSRRRQLLRANYSRALRPSGFHNITPKLLDCNSKLCSKL